ncbi:MAG: ABC transporter substrate-binding protein [Chloroflexi bacterium]|nr:ABC transporter substrate-binding protein [Chloroflexota bacterium]
MSRTVSFLIAAIGVLTLIVATTACAQQPAAPTATPKPAAAPTKSAEQPKPAATAVQPTQPASATKPAQSAKPQQLEVVRVGLQGQASDAAAFVANGKGYFKEQGIDFQFVPISNPGEMVAPLATGQIEAAGVLGSAQFYNALARGVRMKGVADKGRLSKGNGYMALMVRKELVDNGKYKGMADLKGLKVAVQGGTTSPASFIIETGLKTVGLTMKDIDLINLALADMPAALAGGSIDACITAEPFVSRAVDMGAAIRVMGADEITPDFQITGISFSEEFIKSKPDVIKRFVTAYIKGARDFNDAFMKNKGKADVIKILTQATSVKDPTTWERTVPVGINPDGYVNVDSLMMQVEWLLRTEQIKEKPDPKDFLDNQFVDYAISVLGKYNK